MFEKIVLRHSQTGIPLTLGEIAEALLFYQKVHVILDSLSMATIIRTLGTSELLALVERGRITAVYAEDMLMATNENVGWAQNHSFMTAMISGERDKNEILKSRRARLENILVMSNHSRTEARKLAERFIKRIPITRYSSDYFIEGGVHKAATGGLSDPAYLTAAMRRALRDQVGFESFAENLRVNLTKVSADKFYIDSNIDFAAGNARRKEVDPSLESVGESGLLVRLLDASADLNIASFYGGDFYTSLTNSDIVRLRCTELLKRTDISATQLQQFKDIVLHEYPAIREVINSGERSFAEFEKLLDQSEKFRRNVHKMGPDESLVAEYFRETKTEGWLSSLPAKGARFVIGLGLGLVNPVVGAGWGAADSFLLDKLKGWRPNHFVDGKLKPFLDQ